MNNNSPIHLNTTLGTYMPAFFDLYLNTDKSFGTFNILSLTDSERSAFFHEYIHFIQDIATTSGLFNIYVINEYFRLIATQYATENPFTLPVILRNDNYGNVQLNMYINSTIYGEKRDYTFPSVVITQIRTEEKATKLSISKGINHIPIVKFMSNGEWWEFGYKEIMESMAYILQRLCTNSYQSPDFPYLLAEKVATFICPSFANDLLNVLALCDVSLLTDQPGAYFINYVDHIANGKQISKPEDIYDDFYKISGTDCTGKDTTSIQHYEQLYMMAKQSLKSYIAIPCIRCKLNKWIDLIFDTGYNIRKNNRYFFLELAREGNILTNNTFNLFLHKIGSPLMHNNQGDYGRFPSHPDDFGSISQYLLAIYPVICSFNKGEAECYMKPFCISSGRKIDERCIAPWKKIRDYQLCPVATIWKHRKLAVNPIKI